MRGWTLCLLLIAGAPVRADLLLDERFEDFAGTGLSPGGGGGSLDSLSWAVAGFSDGDSAFGDTRVAGDLGRGLSAGGVRGGGLYAFELPGGERGLGLQATSGDFTPGALLRRLTSAAQVSLAGLRVLVDLWVLNDGPRSTGIHLSAASVGPLPGERRAETALLLTPGEADTLGWQHRAHAVELAPLDVLPGDELVLRWLFDDAAGRGARDEVALTRVRVEGIAASEASPVILAAPSSTWLLAMGLLAALAVHRLRIGNRLPIRNPVARRG